MKTEAGNSPPRTDQAEQVGLAHDGGQGDQLLGAVPQGQPLLRYPAGLDADKVDHCPIALHWELLWLWFSFLLCLDFNFPTERVGFDAER